MTSSEDMFGDAVYESGDDDAEYLDPAETLTGETLDGDDLDGPLDTGYSPPEFRPAATRFGTTVDEQHDGETLDQRLAQEEPDLDEETVFGSEEQARAGRLVDPTSAALAERTDGDLVGEDEGLAGGAASAEEAAMHVASEDELFGR